MSTPTLDLDEIRLCLGRYRGLDGHVSISAAPYFVGREFSTSEGGLEQAERYIVEQDARGVAGIYVRGTTLRPDFKGKRGKTSDSHEWVQYLLDLDHGKVVKDGVEGALPYPADRGQVLQLIADAVDAGVVPEPTELRDSGHGIYPVWVLAKAVRDGDGPRQLLVDLHAAMTAYFARAGYEVDPGVRDGARIWRCAGTINRKYPESPVLCSTILRNDAAYTFDELRAAVAVSGPKADARPPVNGPAPELGISASTSSTPAVESDRRFTDEQARAYIEDNALAKVRASRYPRNVNTTLNQAALVLGHFVAGGFFDQHAAYEQLRHALLTGPGAGEGWTDLDDQDRATIQSGLAAGMREPYGRKQVAPSPDVVLVDAAGRTSVPGALVAPAMPLPDLSLLAGLGTPAASRGPGYTPPPAGAGQVAPPGAEVQRRKLAWTPASKVVPLRANWLWETDGYGRIPCGELTIAAGRGNVGKSPFALWCCAQLTQGELPGRYYGERVTVAIYASEDSHAHTTVPRLMAAGADLDRVHLITGTISVAGEEETLEWWRDIELIEEHLKASRAGFLVIDPLFDVYKAGTDTNKSDDVRRGLGPLVAMAHRVGVTILGLAHFNKTRSSDVASMLSGSHGLRDIARAVLAFVETTDGSKVLGQDKNNLGRSGDDVPRIAYEMDIRLVEVEGKPLEVPVFRSLGYTEATIGDLMAGTADTDDIPINPAVAWMFELLCKALPHPMSAGMLETEAGSRGLKWDTVRRKAKQSGLMESEKRTGEAHGGWEWRLTDAGRRRGAHAAPG